MSLKGRGDKGDGSPSSLAGGAGPARIEFVDVDQPRDLAIDDDHASALVVFMRTGVPVASPMVELPVDATKPKRAPTRITVHRCSSLTSKVFATWPMSIYLGSPSSFLQLSVASTSWRSRSIPCTISTIPITRWCSSTIAGRFRLTIRFPDSLTDERRYAWYESRGRASRQRATRASQTQAAT